MKNIPLPKVHKKMPVYLRQDSMNELLDDVSYGEGFEAVRNKLIIAMLYHTGMRRAELIGLRDTDVREGEINLSRKTMSLSWQFRMICQSLDMAIT